MSDVDQLPVKACELLLGLSLLVSIGGLATRVRRRLNLCHEQRDCSQFEPAHGDHVHRSQAQSLIPPEPPCTVEQDDPLSNPAREPDGLAFSYDRVLV